MSRAGIDITGQVFGSLTAIERGSKTPSGAYQWVFQCVCGGRVEKQASAVRNAVKHGRDNRCQSCKSNNPYRIKDGFAYVDVSTRGHQKVETIIDIDDLKHIGGSKWYCQLEHNGLLYVARAHNNQRLHRVITECPKGYEVDHINGDSLDNRRSNLRVVTRRENAQNQKMSTRNKTGVVGVSFVNDRYLAYAVVDGVNTYLGSYETLDEAASVRNTHSSVYHPNHGR